MATTIKKEDLTINKAWIKVKDVVKDTNNFALEATDDLLDGVIKSGTKWQNVMVKASKGGLELASKQQDINYETLETLKKQFNTSFKRLKKIFL